MDLEKELRDNGAKSRKFILVLVALSLITIGPLIVPEVMYTTFIYGILGALGLYFGVNVGHRWATGKVAANVQQPSSNNTLVSDEESDTISSKE